MRCAQSTRYAPLTKKVKCAWVRRATERQYVHIRSPPEPSNETTTNCGGRRGGDSFRFRSEEHTSELQSHSDLHSFPTRRSSDLSCRARGPAVGSACGAPSRRDTRR